MTTFNIVFGVALLFALINLYINTTYQKSICGALIMSSDQVLSDLLKDNKHFTQSRARAEREYRVLSSWWVPLAWSALTTVCVSWWFGNESNGTLTEGDVFWLAVVLTPAIARYYTHKIEYHWLVVWSIGMQSVIVGVQIKSIELKIAELEAIEEPDSIVRNRIEYLKLMLEDMKKATGIELSQTGSVNEE